VHFTVRLPEGSRKQDIDVSLENESRIQDLLTEAARTWGDRLLGAVKTGSIGQAEARHYAAAFPEEYKQAVVPLDAIDDIATVEELQDNSV
jgi:glutamate dehydrogenase